MTESNPRGNERNPTDSESSTVPNSGSKAVLTDGSGVHAPDLTLFQIDILAILAEEPMYGLAIKRELEEYRGEEVNHGRLYPNLDDLVELDLVEKSELDKRTNQYELTKAGWEIVHSRATWLGSKLDLEEDHRLASGKPARADGGDA